MITVIGLLAAITFSDPDIDTDTYLRQHQADADIPGLAVAVVRGDQVSHQFVAGTDGNGRAVTAHTPFLLGSVSKPVTALAVRRLADAGRLDLDAPVRRHLPWFRLADESAAARITARQLITHTSGLPRRAVRTDRFDNSPGGLDAAVRELADVTPGPPRYQYSDANYLVLGAVAAAVERQPFGEVLHEHVLDPLGMRDAVTSEADAVELPPGHRYYLGQPQRFAAPYDTSGLPYGYLGASLTDLTRFVSAQLRAGGPYPGWRESTVDGTRDRAVWHAGAVPGSFAHVVMLPDKNMGIIVLSNVYSPALDGVLASAGFNVARLLSGVAPRSVSGDPAFGIARIGLIGLALVLLGGVVGSVVRPSRRRSRRRTLAALAGWLAGCGGVIAGALTLPSTMGGDLTQALLWTPDVGHGIVVVVVLAAALALTRVIMSLCWSAWRSGRQQRPTGHRSGRSYGRSSRPARPSPGRAT